MYDRDYARRKHEWKTCLKKRHKIARKIFAENYLHFNWKRVVSTDEIFMCKAERQGMLKAWQLSDEKYEKGVREFKTDNFATEMIWSSFVYERKKSIYFEYEKTQKKKKRLQHLLDLKNQNKQLAHYLIFASLLALRELKAEEKEKKKSDLVSQLSVNLRNNIKTRSDQTKKHDVDVASVHLELA